MPADGLRIAQLRIEAPAIATKIESAIAAIVAGRERSVQENTQIAVGLSRQKGNAQRRQHVVNSTHALQLPAGNRPIYGRGRQYELSGPWIAVQVAVIDLPPNPGIHVEVGILCNGPATGEVECVRMTVPVVECRQVGAVRISNKVARKNVDRPRTVRRDDTR